MMLLGGLKILKILNLRLRIELIHLLRLRPNLTLIRPWLLLLIVHHGLLLSKLFLLLALLWNLTTLEMLILYLVLILILLLLKIIQLGRVVGWNFGNLEFLKLIVLWPLIQRLVVKINQSLW